MKRIIIVFTCCMLLSCYKDIELSSYQGEEQIVLNCLANTDTTVMCDISMTWLYTKHKPSESISDMTVELFANGQQAGNMVYQDGKYRSNYHPKQGDVLMIKTSFDGNEVFALDSVPQKAEITAISISHHRVIGTGDMSIDPYGNITQDDYNDEFTYSITFKTAAQGENYYFLSVDGTDYQQILGTLDYSYEPLFLLASETINRTLSSLKVEGQFGLPFSFNGNSGQEYTLTIKETGAPYFYENDGDRNRKITLYSISKSYYKYVMTLLANDDASSWQGGLTEIGLTEPISIYSNIVGGIGIFGSVTSNSKIICLPDALNMNGFESTFQLGFGYKF